MAIAYFLLYHICVIRVHAGKDSWFVDRGDGFKFKNIHIKHQTFNFLFKKELSRCDSSFLLSLCDQP